MNVLVPVTFVEATHLVSTTAVESVSAWSSGTTYADTNLVYYGSRIYESQQNANTNKQPDINQPTWWLDIGPTNKTAMFDTVVNTQTVKATSLNVVLNAPSINAVSMMNMTGANSITVVGYLGSVSGTIVFEEVRNIAQDVPDWYEYFFSDIEPPSDQLFSNIPTYTNLVLQVLFEGGTDLAVGLFMFGKLFPIGITQHGAKAGIIDYSTKEVDTYGNTTIVERAFSKRLSCTVFCENGRLNATIRTLSSLRAKPCVWVGLDNDSYSEPLHIFGYYRDFSVDIAYPNHSLCSIEIEGLI